MKKTISTNTHLFLFDEDLSDEQEESFEKKEFIENFGNVDTLLSDCLSVSKDSDVEAKKQENSKPSQDSGRSCSELIKELIKSKDLSVKEIEASGEGTVTDDGPSPEEMMQGMPEDAKKMYEAMEKGQTPPDPAAGQGGGN